MKITIDDYEIDINARHLWRGSKEMNEDDTRNFLIAVSLWASDAGDKNEADGYHATADACKKAFREIFAQTH